MIEFYGTGTLRMIVFFASVLMLTACIVTAQIAMYFYGKEDKAWGILTVLLYIPWMILVILFAGFSSQGSSKIGFPFFLIASLCAGLPHRHFLKNDNKRLKTAAIYGIISVVCVTQMWTGFFAFALWGYDWL